MNLGRNTQKYTYESERGSDHDSEVEEIEEVEEKFEK